MANNEADRPVTIVADAAESASGIPDALKRLPGVSLEIERLEYGDYLIGPGHVVERKSAQDFAASIMDGRLFSQLKLMKAVFPEGALLLIEGNVFERVSAIADEALRGAMSEIAVLSRIPIAYSRDPPDSARLLRKMAIHAAHGLGYEINLHPSKPPLPKLLAEYVIGALPGVGPGRANAILRHFGSVRGVMAASEKALASVPGVGPKTAQRIAALLDLRCS